VWVLLRANSVPIQKEKLISRRNCRAKRGGGKGFLAVNENIGDTGRGKNGVIVRRRFKVKNQKGDQSTGTAR